jgi:hypothetical protein
MIKGNKSLTLIIYSDAVLYIPFRNITQMKICQIIDLSLIT